jgi:hypothetical protein
MQYGSCLSFFPSTEVFHRYFFAILHAVIHGKYDGFIGFFYTFSKTTNAFPNITIDVQRLT